MDPELRDFLNALTAKPQEICLDENGQIVTIDHNTGDPIVLAKLRSYDISFVRGATLRCDGDCDLSLSYANRYLQMGKSSEIPVGARANVGKTNSWHVNVSSDEDGYHLRVQRGEGDITELRWHENLPHLHMLARTVLSGVPKNGKPKMFRIKLYFFDHTTWKATWKLASHDSAPEHQQITIYQKTKTERPKLVSVKSMTILNAERITKLQEWYLITERDGAQFIVNQKRIPDYPHSVQSCTDLLNCCRLAHSIPANIKLVGLTVPPVVRDTTEE